VEFLKTYCNLTESEARVSSDMTGRLREQEMEGMASPIVQQMRFKDSVVRAKVAAGIRSYVRNKTHI